MCSTSTRIISSIIACLITVTMLPALSEASTGVDYSTYSEVDLLSAYEAVTNQLEQIGYRFVIDKVELSNSVIGDEPLAESSAEDAGSMDKTSKQTEQFTKALELAESGDYKEALAIFEALADFQDAREQAIVNAGLYAQILFDTEDYKACQQLLLQYPSESTAELLSKSNDQAFLLDLATALSERWDNANKDTTLMSEKKLIEYFSSLVNGELVHIGKYSELEFYDPQLKEYAHNYIGALQSQLTGIMEYYGKDENAYNEYWVEYGFIKRQIAIFWLNKKYGLELDSKYEEALKEAVMNGIYYDKMNSIKNMLEKQLFTIDYAIKKKDGDNSVELSSFKIFNTSQYTIESINIRVKYLDAFGGNVSEGYLYTNTNGVKNEGIMVTDPAWIYYNFFDSLVFEYEFSVSDDRYYETVTGTVKPKVQYKWDGKIYRDGSVLGGQEIIELEGPSSGWETKYSLYVPYLKFSVKNTGTANADRIVVKTVFTDKETKEIWDTDTNYVIGSSDAPLKPGYSKKVFSYAGVGFKSKPSASQLPKLDVEVYINDVLVLTQEIGN